MLRCGYSRVAIFVCLDFKHISTQEQGLQDEAKSERVSQYSDGRPIPLIASQTEVIRQYYF